MALALWKNAEMSESSAKVFSYRLIDKSMINWSSLASGFEILLMASIRV